MSDDIEINIRSVFDATAARLAQKELAQLTDATKKAAAAGGLDKSLNANARAAASAAQSYSRTQVAAERMAAAQAQTAAAAARLQQAQNQAAAAATRTAQESARLATAQNQVTTSAARAAQAQNQVATSAQRAAQAELATARAQAQLEAEQSRAAQAALRLAQAREKAAKPPSKGLTAYFQDLGKGIAGAAAGVVAAGAVIEGVKGTIESFADAINFKAQLDATTSAVNIQLRGMRDSGQVWAAASAYAQKYKLTQEETTNAVRASVAIFRNSNASVEDTLGVLQRLTVLAPGKSIEDAAFSVKELASGDITSIAEQFDISRKQAYAMRDAINGGADVVQVLSKYLNDAGVSMDTLKVKTEGVLGAQKDLLIAQEDLKKAQAEWAQGPGLTIMQAQILATRGATRTLSGDWQAIAQSQQQAIDANPALKLNPLYMAMAKAVELVAQRQRDLTAAQQEGAQQRIDASFQAGLMGLAAAYQAGTISSAQYSAAVANLTAQHDALLAGTTSVTSAETAATDATDRHTEAQQLAAVAAAQRQSAIAAVVTGLVEQGAKEVTGTEQANALYAIQSDLASIGGAVAQGHMTAGEGALALAGKYGIAIDQARLLLDLQAQIAGGKARLAGQQANTRELAPQGVGYNAPGRTGTSDVDAAVKGYQEAKKAAEDAKAAEEAYNLKVADHAGKLAILRGQLSKATVNSKEYYDILGQIKDEEGRTAKAGGARANAEASLSARILAIARKTGDELIAIDKRVAEEREKNLRKLAADIQTTTSSMVAQQEADDLDLVGASAEEADRLRAREQAQAKARVAEAQAVSEAKQTAAEGDAQTATEVYDLRQQQIQAQQELDEKYYQKQQELAGDNKAQEELTTQYNEATAAINDDTDTRIALAQQEADQRAAALATEKQAVLDKAAAEAAALDATGKAGSTAADRVAALDDALRSLPENVTTTITVTEVRNSSATTSGGGSSEGGSSSGGSAAGGSAKAAGGVEGYTTGPTTLTVGDNPGGVEYVKVVPISGRGRSSITGSGIRMAGGGEALVDAAAADADRRLGSGTTPSLPPAATGGGGGGGSSTASSAGDTESALKAVEDALRLLEAEAELRSRLEDVGPPIDLAMAQALADEATAVADVVGRTMVPVSKEAAEDFGRFVAAEQDAIKVLVDAAGLRKDVSEAGPPLDLATITALADEAEAVADTVGRRFVRVGVIQLENFKRYADAIGAGVGVLKDVAGLDDEAIAAFEPPSDAQLAKLVQAAEQTATAFTTAAATYEGPALDGAKTFAEATGAVYDTVGKGLEAIERLSLTDLAIDPAQLQAFVDDTRLVTGAVAELGAAALAVPGGATDALQGVASAVDALTQAYVNLASVPSLESLPLLPAGGGGGMTMGDLNFYITQQPGQNAAQLADAIADKVGQRLGRRAAARK